MNNPPVPHDYEEHKAWLDSLSPDEASVVHTPPGYLLSFLIVALTKRALLSEGIKPQEQLTLLEKMNGLTDMFFVPEMLAKIDPMSDTEVKIYQEAKSLDPPDDKLGQASFNVLTSPRVFWHFVTCNPGLLAAVRLGHSRWEQQESAEHPAKTSARLGENK